MLGKKDNQDIFKQYKTILLEQVQDEFSILINKIKTSSLDQASKDQLIQLVASQKEHGTNDADAAGYASYPDAMPAMDQDDQDTINDEDRDSSFADEMRMAQEKQRKQYPEQPPYSEDEENQVIALIKKDLDAAIAAGDQKRANELFDELRNYNTRKPSYGTASLAGQPDKREDWSKRKPAWADAFVRGATGGRRTGGT